MISKIIQDFHFIQPCSSTEIAAAEDFATGDPVSDVFNMENAQGAVFHVYKLAGATGTIVVTVEACDDVTPSNTAAIPFTYRTVAFPDTVGAVTDATSAGFTIAAGANAGAVIEVDASDVRGEGYNYMRLQLTEGVDSPLDGGVTGFLYGRRYKDSQAAQVT